MRKAILLLLLGAACESVPRTPVALPGTADHAVIVCGRAVATEAPVVSWMDGPHYDGYQTERRFDASATPAPQGLRYQPGRTAKLPGGDVAVLVAPGSRDLAALQRVIDLFVLHYDVCGTSETCFRVLHDERGLSVHFLLDVDGTIYQTLDLRDQAWHATVANPRAIGIEIAHIGAYPPDKRSPLDEWYVAGDDGVRLDPQRIRRDDRAYRPARTERVRGRIHGVEYEQPDFTPEQYASLVQLTATLCAIFPQIHADVPRGADGRVRSDALDADEFPSYHGLVGHYHVTRRKIDPGPAFDWERYLTDVRRAIDAGRATPLP